MDAVFEWIIEHIDTVIVIWRVVIILAALLAIKEIKEAFFDKEDDR